MATECAAGVLAIPAATGNLSVATLTFKPTVLIVWMGYNTADGRTNGPGAFGWGAAADDGGVLTQGYIAGHDNDNAATSQAARSMNTDALLRSVRNNAGTFAVDMELDIVSFNANGFTINRTDAPATANVRLHYLALGGDIQGGRVFSFQYTPGAPPALTAFNVTVPFTTPVQPDLVLLAAQDGNTHPTALGQQADDFNVNMGVGYKAGAVTDQMLSGWGVDNGAGTSGNWLYQKSGSVLAGVNNVPPISYEAKLDVPANWPANGFRVVPVTNATSGPTNLPVLCVAMRGPFQKKVGTMLTSTTLNGAVDFAAGFAPRAALFFGGNQLANTSLISGSGSGTRLGSWGMGVYDGTNENYADVNSDDANATAENTGNSSSTAKAWQSNDPQATAANAPVLAGEADASFSVNNVRLTWTDADTATRQLCVLALGDSAVASTPVDISGSMAGAGAASGAVAATARASGQLDGDGAASGQSQAVATFTGVSAGAGSIVGQVAAQSQLSSAAMGTGSMVGAAEVPQPANVTGSVVGVGIATGAATARTSVLGASTGSGTTSGQARATSSASGLVAGSGQTSGSVVAVPKLAGTSIGTGGATGSVRATPQLTGAAAGVGSGTATPAVTLNLSGSLAGVGGGGGGLSAFSILLGNLSSQGQLSGVTIASPRLTGASTGAGALVGVPGGATAAQGTLLGTGTATGGAQSTTQLSGVLGGSGGTGGAATATPGVTGSATGSGTSTGSIRTAASVVGETTGTGGLDAILTTPGPVFVEGSMEGSGDTIGTLRTAMSLTGSLVSTGDVATVVVTPMGVAGVTTGTGDATGQLTTVAQVQGSMTSVGVLTGDLVSGQREFPIVPGGDVEGGVDAGTAGGARRGRVAGATPR